MQPPSQLKLRCSMVNKTHRESVDRHRDNGHRWTDEEGLLNELREASKRSEFGVFFLFMNTDCE